MASAADIQNLRRMTGVTVSEYADDVLAAIIDRYPLPDANGLFPEEAGWTPRYDLNAAAADVWEERAAVLASQYDFNADGASFQRSQQYENYMKQARHFRSRSAITSVRLVSYPRPEDDDADER